LKKVVFGWYFLGGQFKSATHGQFKSAQGGQFDRNLHYMQSIFFQQELKRKTVTSIQSGVYLEELGNCRFIIPDVDSVHRIKDISTNHRLAKNDIKSKIASSKALQQSLINQIF
jgi:hypothetical protein